MLKDPMMKSFVAARHKFRGEISKLVNSLERVQREAAQGTHGAQQIDLKNDVREGNVNSDSRDSSDDVEIPPGSDEGFFGDECSLRKRGPLIGDNTDFKCFKWVVG